MNWIWLAGGGLFIVAAVAVFIAFRNPDFVLRFFKAAAWGIFNALLPIILKQKTPEDEAKWHDAIRRGEEWDHVKNRPKDSK